MLTIVALVLRTHPVVEVLEQSTHAISDFLGPPPSLMLSEACQFGSIRLLNWIWSTCCTTSSTRRSGWSLSNYLRSDSNYHNWQFSKSLEVAAGRGDLPMVKWLLAHFSGCEAPESVCSTAQEKGYVHILWFLWKHQSNCRGYDSKSSTCDSAHFGEADVKRECTIKFTRSMWSLEMIQKAIENGQFVECVNEGMYVDDGVREAAIKHALTLGKFDLAQQLLPRGRCMLDYAAGCPNIEVIEWMFACGYLRRDGNLAASTIPVITSSGRLELAEMIIKLHSPLPESHEYWTKAWSGSLKSACSAGNLKFLQWLMDHPLGEEAREIMRSNKRKNGLLCVAAENGSVDIMDYLYDNGLAEDYDEVMKIAITEGQTSAAKWLIHHHSFDAKSKRYIRAICRSVENGYPELLSFFHELDSVTSVGNADTKRRRIDHPDSWWSCTTDPIYWAAKRGQIAVLEWFHSNRPQNCDLYAMEVAARQGRLETVKWLHVNRSEGCSKRAINGAAENGHLDVVQWLQANRSEGCTDMSMYRAAENGHLEMIKWLFATMPESRTHLAIDRAIRSGHLRVADWLLVRYPDYKIGSELEAHKSLVEAAANYFETLLWLQAHASYAFTSRFLERIRQDISWRSHGKQHLLRHVSNWLDENFAGETQEK
ncbi:hypothetical protein L915_01621 [Phytophthora nicotianae]|uniref:Uncharacterized protein n=1 Tax=Phytophthora nicotianae TaxID=4792 RepID=W2HK13_PHYNI|nr:hypothetical protein L915_01621 [Phytophthora nicotianae]